MLWHTVENEKFTLTKIFSRQINSLVIYLVNALISRNFCQRSMRVNYRNFHSVCGKVLKNGIISFTEKSTFFPERTHTTTLHTAVEITEIYSHAFLAKIS